MLHFSSFCLEMDVSAILLIQVLSIAFSNAAKRTGVIPHTYDASFPKVGYVCPPHFLGPKTNGPKKSRWVTLQPLYPSCHKTSGILYRPLTTSNFPFPGYNIFILKGPPGYPSYAPSLLQQDDYEKIKTDSNDDLTWNKSEKGDSSIPSGLLESEGKNKSGVNEDPNASTNTDMEKEGNNGECNEFPCTFTCHEMENEGNCNSDGHQDPTTGSSPDMNNDGKSNGGGSKDQSSSKSPDMEKESNNGDSNECPCTCTNSELANECNVSSELLQIIRNILTREFGLTLKSDNEGTSTEPSPIDMILGMEDEEGFQLISNTLDDWGKMSEAENTSSSSLTGTSYTNDTPVSAETQPSPLDPEWQGLELQQIIRSVLTSEFGLTLNADNTSSLNSVGENTSIVPRYDIMMLQPSQESINKTGKCTGTSTDSEDEDTRNNGGNEDPSTSTSTDSEGEDTRNNDGNEDPSTSTSTGSKGENTRNNDGNEDPSTSTSTESLSEDTSNSDGNEDPITVTSTDQASNSPLVSMIGGDRNGRYFTIQMLGYVDGRQTSSKTIVLKMNDQRTNGNELDSNSLEESSERRFQPLTSMMVSPTATTMDTNLETQKKQNEPSTLEEGQDLELLQIIYDIMASEFALTFDPDKTSSLNSVGDDKSMESSSTRGDWGMMYAAENTSSDNVTGTTNLKSTTDSTPSELSENILSFWPVFFLPRKNFYASLSPSFNSMYVEDTNSTSNASKTTESSDDTSTSSEMSGEDVATQLSNILGPGWVVMPVSDADETSQRDTGYNTDPDSINTYPDAGGVGTTDIDSDNTDPDSGNKDPDAGGVGTSDPDSGNTDPVVSGNSYTDPDPRSSSNGNIQFNCECSCCDSGSNETSSKKKLSIDLNIRYSDGGDQESVESIIKHIAAIRASEQEGATIQIQNFKDVYYFGTVHMGSPPQEFKCDFDTGSSDFWVPSNEMCEYGNYSCYNHSTYSHDDSSTYRANGTKFSITYGSGAVSGYCSQDDLIIGGMNIKNQIFGEATYLDDNTAGNEYDCIMGLGWPSLSNLQVEPPIFNMINQNLIDDHVFCFYLSKGSSSNSTLDLGGADDRHYRGDFVYTKVVTKTYWLFTMSHLTCGGKTMVSNAQAITDSGTSLIYGPYQYTDKINKAMGASSIGQGLYSVPCSNVSNLPLITIGVGENSLPLEPEAYILKFQGVCISSWTGTQEKMWILGDVIMRRYYTCFDIGRGQIGFAEAK